MCDMNSPKEGLGCDELSNGMADLCFEDDNVSSTLYVYNSIAV